MATTERLLANNPAHLVRAAELLRRGGTVAFPTETVYGLGANALDPAAVEKIFVAKQRPHWDPLIVHIADLAQLPQVAEVTSRKVHQLIERFWPGPLTLLLPRNRSIPDAVTAGRPLVGVRMPNHPVALALLRLAGVAVAAPSANTFGHTSPTTAQHVLDDLDGRIDAVLDGGPAQVGLESTVIEVDHEGIVVYRPGDVVLESDFSIDPPMDLGWIRTYKPPLITSAPESMPSPGVGIRHYAPRANLLLVSPDPHSTKAVQDLLIHTLDLATTGNSKASAMLPEGWNASAADLRFAWGPWHNHAVLAHRLYDGLRTLDEAGATIIVCPMPQGEGIAEAIRDRLTKAART